MRHVVIGTAGHIDHGKSALVLALTGTDPDRLKEEKARGITIDLGFAHAEIDGVTFAFVDVPGHERFVKNMLAGATGIDAVALVVAADESVMPQTREHFDICRLLQVGAGLIVITKSDLADPETIELVALEARDLVAGSFLEGAPLVAVSARTGAGLDVLRRELLALAGRLTPRATDGPARMAVDRAFSVKGFGTVVTGTLASGAVDLDADLELLPSGRRVKVRGLQGHGRTLERAVAGQRVAMNLAGVDLDAIVRGDTLAEPDSLGASARFDARLDALPEARPLKHGARVRVHAGTSEVLGRVALATLTAPGEAAHARNEIPPGASAYVRVRLEHPVALTRGDRFILRAYSPQVTIAGGVVLDPAPPRGAIRTERGRTRFVALDAGAQEGADANERVILRLIEESGVDGFPARALVSRAGLTQTAAADATSRLTGRGAVAVIGDRLVARAPLEQAERRLLEALREYHAGNPLSDGLPREEARERVFARAPAAVFEHVLRELTARQGVTGRERLALTSHRVHLSGEDAKALDAVERSYRRAGLKPPDPSALALELRVGAPAVDKAVQLLLRRRALVRIDTLVFHQSALETLKGDVAALKQSGAIVTIDVGTFKERFGLSRKFAIPLLEYLDRERVTRRVGEGRVIL